MKTQYEITEKDYVNAMQLSSRYSYKIISLYVVLLALVWISWANSDFSFLTPLVHIINGLIIFVLVMKLFIYPIVAKRTYRKYKNAHEAQYLELKNDGLELSSANGEFLLKWSAIYKWRDNDKYLLIYQNPSIYQIIPKRVSNNGFNMGSLLQKLEVEIGKAT